MSLGDAELLEAYFASRRMAEETKHVFKAALRGWGRDVGVPLCAASSADVSKWYGALCSRGLKAGTIVNWTSKLRMLTRFSLGRQMSARDVEYRSDELWSVVPLSDLVKESKRSGSDRDKVISEEELRGLLRAASHPRVKAFIATLFESGCRKGELKSLKIRDITFGPLYAEIRVNGKTGERTIPLVFSVPYIRAWLQVHPDRQPEQWLFAYEKVGRVEQMKGSTPSSTIRYLCRKAGIRHIHPHMLRHTKMTELARAGVSEYQMDGLAGWVVGSGMPRRYIHLSGRDHINAVLESQGIEVPHDQRPRPMLMGEHCPNCDALIGQSMLYCPGCGYVLDPNVRHDVTPGSTEERIEKLGAEMRRLMAEFEELKDEPR